MGATAAATDTTNKDDAKRFANLIGPTDPKVDREARERLITARVGMLLRASFFGNLATRLKLVNADEWCATAATDGRNFYYNSRFIMMLRPRELEFLFGHEVLHCIYDHFGRRGNRDPQLWNIANDYCVNADLKKHRVGEFITTVPCLYDAKYEDLSSEEIYDKLYENAEKINLDDLINRMIDEHMDGDDDSKGSGEQGGKGPEKLTAQERDKIRDEIKEAMLAAAATVDGVGNLPLGVRRAIQQLTEPRLNWREMIRMNIQSTVKSDFTWMRSSRRGWHMDAIMPGMKNDDMVDVVVFVDASGSINENMLKDFLAEIQGIMDAFSEFRIHVATFDTKVYNPVDYTSDNLDNICDYEITGGGGTDFDAMYHYMRENDIQPKRMIVFTDGYPYGSWGEEDYCDVTWVLHGTTTIVPPWGSYAYYDESARK
jgi:predicted metal-dependent peptidase